jgi:putative addiction module antidote
MQTKVRKIGNGYGVLLPKQILDELRMEEGSVLNIVRKDDGVMLSHYDADFADQLEAFRRTEAVHRNSYRELAK